MVTKPVALYHNLLSDLARILPLCTIKSLEQGLTVAPWPDISPQQFAALALGSNFLRKFGDDPLPSADAAAVDLFVRDNDRAREFEFRLTPDLHPYVLEAYEEAKLAFRDLFVSNRGPIFDAFSLREGLNVGPGSASGSVGNSFYEKLFAGPLSATSSEVVRLYQAVVSSSLLWDEAEKIRFAQFGAPTIVGAPGLATVPKRTDIARCVKAEPAVNMLLQRAVGSVIERILCDRLGLNLTDQWVHNQSMAKLGSLTMRFSTFDLESASDSISRTFFADFAPPELLWWCNVLRSEKTTLPSKEVIELHAVATMGNGFTFPLQTAIFACFVIGCYRIMNIPVRRCGTSGQNFAVFGDDIIVDSKVNWLLTSLLTYCGFRVNRKKSFLEGDFRESCGGDYLRGHLVRPVYCRHLRTDQDYCALINRLNAWTATTGICLRDTVRTLMEWSKEILFVPLWETDTAGIQVTYQVASRNDLMRSEKGLFAYERFVAKSPSIDVSWGPVCYANEGSWIHPTGSIRDFIRNRGRRKDLPRPLFVPHSRSRVYENPPGILIAALRGGLRDGKLTIKSRFTVYRKGWSCTPNWDYTSVITDKGSFFDVDATRTFRLEKTAGEWAHHMNVAVHGNLASSQTQRGEKTRPAAQYRR